MRFKRIHVTVVLVMSLAYSTISVAEQLIEDTNIVLQKDYDTEFKFTVFQDFQGSDPTSIFFDVNANATTAFLPFLSINIDEGSDWYLAGLDDVFNEESICSAEFIFWGGFEKDSGIPSTGRRLELPFGEYYLGVNTGSGFDGDIPRRDIFGWVKIRVGGDDDIELLDNAVVYGGTGIIIGRNYTSIPEPMSSFWILTGFVAGISKRRPRY